MKKNMSVIISMILLASCANNDISSLNEEIIKENHRLKIMVATDLHLLSNNLVDINNIVETKKRLTSDGRVQEYDYKLVNELLFEVYEHEVDYLLLSGDLTFNGEYDSHVELKKILDMISEHCKVLLVPGNHDYNNIYSMSYINGESNYVKGLTYDEFADFYVDYGYDNAISYDKKSLSYFYKLDDSTYVLMLDSTGSEYNYEYGMNIVGGELEKETMIWIENNLKMAKEKNKEVISVMHHNLLVHNELFKNSYTLYNSQELIDLYKQYDVRVNFSGHLHIQSIKNDENLYDIANGSILDYGNRFGILDIYDNCYDYNTYSLSPNLGFNFNSYSYEVFYQKYYNKQLLIDQNTYKRNANKITNLNSMINAYYFDGNYQKIHEIINENKALIRQVERNENAKYMHSIYDVENKNQHSVLIKK